MRKQIKQSLLAAMLAVAGLTTSAAAQSNQTAPATQPSTVPTRITPEWVQPGMRITYFGTVAALELPSSQVRADSHGTFPLADGRRLSEVELANLGRATITELTIIAVENDQAAMDVRSFSWNVADGRITFIGSNSTVTTGAFPQWFVHPAALQTVPDQVIDQTRISRAEVNLRGVPYSAIQFETVKPDSIVCYTYDAKSGVLLHINTAAPSQKSTGKQYDGKSPTVNVDLSTFRFLEARQATLPWTGDKLADSLKVGQTLEYTGNVISDQKGLSRDTVSFKTTIRIDELRGTWCKYSVLSEYAMNANSTPRRESTSRMSGAGSINGAILPAAGLAKLEAGTTLAEDRNMKSRTFVAMKTDTSVTIVEEAAGMRNETTYDIATGVMTASLSVTETSNAITTFMMHLKKD